MLYGFLVGAWLVSTVLAGGGFDYIPFSSMGACEIAIEKINAERFWVRSDIRAVCIPTGVKE